MISLEAAHSVPDAPLHRVTEYRDVKHILQSRTFAPIRAESGHGAQWHTQLVADSLGDLYGEDHVERRKLLSVLFRRATLVEYDYGYVAPALKDVLEKVRAKSENTSDPIKLDLLDVTRHILLGLLVRLVGLVGFDDDDDRIRRFGDDFQFIDRGARAKWVDDPEPVVLDALKAQDRIIEEYFQPAWDHHVELMRKFDAGEIEREEVPNDLISLMLRHEPHYSRFSSRALMNEATLFIIASVGSTTNSLCTAVADLDAWLNEHPEDAHLATDPEFIRHAYSESLRLGQNNVLLKTAMADDTLPSGMVIKEGEVVACDRVVANVELAETSDSDAGGDTFDPHRVMAAGAAQYGLAFGDGVHVCIGRPMVLDRSDRDPSAPNARIGTGAMILLELYRAGVRIPPDDRPAVHGDMTQRTTWKTFPVVFSFPQGE